MRKMLFIIPNKLSDVPEHLLSDLQGPKIVPYGVISIITYVRANPYLDVEFKVLDLNTEYSEYLSYENIIVDTIIDFEPDIVAISVLFNNLVNQLLSISNIVKRVKPDCIIIAGGNCVSNEYDNILQISENIDGICYSEGEIPILRLLSAEDLRNQMYIDPSFITKKALNEGKIPVPSYIEDLNQIPFSDLSLVDLKRYDPYPSRTRVFAKNDIALSIHTTRGCPFNCIFCCASKMHGKKMRYMSAKYTLDFVDFMIEKYGLTILTIEDDNFLVDKKRAKEILNGLILFKQQGRLKSVNILTVAVNYIDEEIVSLFKALDISNINIASEHGTEYMLKKVIEKPCTLDQIKNVVALFKKYDLFCILSIVVGIPDEREIDRVEAVNFYLELGVDWVSINIATPYRGSRLYDICIEKGYINAKDLETANLRRSIINTPDISASEITEKAYIMNLELNFVNNYSIRKSDYVQAINRLGDLANRYPDHAFAHYYLSKAYKGIGNNSKYLEHMKQFHEIVNNSAKWKEYATHFGLINNLS